MPKKVSEIKKKEILESFIRGSNIKEISVEYNFSITTITRQLKNALGEDKFNEIKKSKLKDKFKKTNRNLISIPKKNSTEEIITENFSSFDENQDLGDFIELEPIVDGTEFEKQRDVSSKPLKNIKLPKIVYMIIEKEIELKPKLLNDYPEWRFLPSEDLNRYTIEIFSEQKDAKMKCNKNQKPLKVPNPNVFLIASKKLKLKGISRIIFEDLLISI